MSRETAPPGKTFAERWPHDASEREYQVASSIPFVLGGLAGLFAVPSLLAQMFLFAPVIIATPVVAALLLSWIVIGRSEARPRRSIVWVWKLAAWIALAVALGVLLTVVGRVLCGGVACATDSRLASGLPLATLVTFALSIGGAMVITIGVDRAGRRIARRDRATDRR